MTMNESVDRLSLNGAESDNGNVKELDCPCCYELLLDPTSLDCGHTVCRHCLASWHESNSSRLCPVCRQQWSGSPKINILLRDIVTRLHKDTSEQRRHDILGDSSIQNVLKSFEDSLDEQSRRNTQNTGYSSFWIGCCVAFFVYFVSTNVYDWLHPEPTSPTMSVQHWNSEMVVDWLRALNNSWSLQMAEAAQRRGLDGQQLLDYSEGLFAMDDINSTMQPYVKAHLLPWKSSYVPPAQDFWEFKDREPQWVIFLLMSLSTHPRFTLLYLALFAWQDTLLPLTYVVSPLGEAVLPQWLVLSAKLLLVPHYYYAVFAVRVLGQLSSWYAVGLLLLFAFRDSQRVTSVIRSRELPYDGVMSWLTDCMSDMFAVLLYRVSAWCIPHFLCAPTFYISLVWIPIREVRAARHHV